ncbi:hypothetical protein [Trichlorobacter ammonificans]|uniref:General secretion pathway protein GspM n=1 Tax=Trichlorobacter ammonificans TaxID=2916410 RepID=A0ABM9DBZ7_9BACT|nr:hypothetical protein [Trichlorobacter ammonificans]CAH2032359.1 protein of unknown function [Trichlorobacter ammonificans]
MNAALLARTRQASRHLIVLLALCTLLGILLAVMVRTEQSLARLKVSHRTIVANLPRMVEDTRLMQEQIANFRQLVPAGGGERSTELLLFSRLDQIKAALNSGEMTVSALEKKDGSASIGFSLKLPLPSYPTVINALGRLQTETFPFVVVTKVVVDGNGAGQFTVDGSVLMPLAAGGSGAR